MSATTNRSVRSDDETQPAVPQISPPDIGYGHPNFFPMQAILDIKGSLGEIKANIENLSRSVDSMKAKVDDLVKWKTLVLGGAIVIGVLVSGTTLLLSNFSITVAQKSPNIRTQPFGPSVVEAPSQKKY